MLSLLKRTLSLFQNAPAKRDLPYILAQANSKDHLDDRLEWMGMLLTWLRAPIELNESKVHRSRVPAIRMKFLMQLLDRNPEWKFEFSEVFASFFTRTRGIKIFAYVGLLEGKGLADQLTDIIVERVLPLSEEEDDLSGLIIRLFDQKDDAAWIEELPESILEEISQLIETVSPLGKRIWNPLREDLIDALHLIAIQIAAIGTSQSIWSRLGSPSPSNLAFIRLQDSVRLLVDHLREKANPGTAGKPLIESISTEISACKESVEQVIQHLQQSGVNMGLIFRIHHLSVLLLRLDLLVSFLQSIQQNSTMLGLRRLMVEMIRAVSNRHDMTSLFRGNTQLLSLRVVEHAGCSGEHYIARNQREYWQMLRSAAGGGILTVGTTLIKFAIIRFKFPIFIEALGHWLNYSCSFLLMQSLHFTLATKQPSMTASALAKKLAADKSPEKSLELASEIRSIIRSQIAAVIGNIGLAIPTAFFVSWVSLMLLGHPPFPIDFAKYSVDSLHPFQSMTLLFAIITGILLWISSIFAGWVENWMAFHQISDRLRGNRRIRLAFDGQAGKFCAEFLTRNISGIAGNISLGFLLAILPFIGRVTGLPLDVRHVTLSTAQLSIAIYSGADQLSSMSIMWAVLGILATGMLNFGVSFWLALSVAARAHQVRKSVKKDVSVQLRHLFRTDSISFIVPSRKLDELNLS